jgi:hypothetical protein
MIMSFWFRHGVLALLVQAVLATPVALLGFPLWQAAAFGAAFVVGAYVSRERHQAEVGSGSASIPLWQWSGNPKAAMDIAVPAALVSAATLAAYLLG